ncbi:MAG: hypothetical protein ACK5VI_00515 [Opitutia bacterium]|jgi:hypothetical protein
MPVPLPCLCLDGAVRDRPRGGIWLGDRWLAELHLEGDPAETFAPLAQSLLEVAGLGWGDLRSLALNQGPGSVLGIRAAAVSLQAWSVVHGIPVHGWSGHLAAAWAAVGTCDGVVSEGRGGKWVLHRVGAEAPVGTLSEVETAEAVGLRLRPLAGGFRHGVPPGMGDEVDAWAALPGLLASRGLAVATDHPDALNSPAAHALWSGRRHGASAP